MRCDHLDKLREILSRLGLADAADVFPVLDGYGLQTGEEFQRGVVEDDVGGNTLALRDLQALLLQLLEQRFIKAEFQRKPLSAASPVDFEPRLVGFATGLASGHCSFTLPPLRMISAPPSVMRTRG